MPLLGYGKWQRFRDAIDRAIDSATTSGYEVADRLEARAKLRDTQKEFKGIIYSRGVRKQVEIAGSKNVFLIVQHPAWLKRKKI